ncbi:MAG: hypothetical protein RR929_02530 [Erysipelotrichaceae bacterium]
MKLVVSKAVVNGIVTRLGQLGFKVAVEFEAATGEKISSENNNFLSDIPLFHKIENVVSKAVTVTRSDSEVTIDVNDQLIDDYINMTFNLYEELVSPMVQCGMTLKKHMNASFEFQKKWQEDVVEVPAGVFNTNVGATPSDKTESNESKELFGWSLTNPNKDVSFSFRVVNLDTLDDVTVVHDLKAVRHGQELVVSAFNVQTICESKTSLQETARRCGYPITLIKAVREYFGFNSLTDTSVDAAE